MKAAGGFTRPWPTVAVVALFVLGAFLLSCAVQTSGLTTAYTIGLGIEAILAIVLGVHLFGEHLSPAKLIGVALILVGVAGLRLG